MSFKDPIGDRMKDYESREQTRFLPMIPIVARLDGQTFSNFTRGLEKPWDKRLSDPMVDITLELVKISGAKVGYTQSDEINLVFYADNYNSEIYFGGRKEKMITSLASRTAILFERKRREYLGDFKIEHMANFDCRANPVPNLIEAANYIMWREQDATRNSIQSAAQAYFSHNFLMEKNTKQMKDLLIQEKGINWNSYPSQFKRGTYIQRAIRCSKLQIDELDLLPEKHHARQNPDLEIERSVIGKLDLPRFSSIANPIDVIFQGLSPVIRGSDVPGNQEDEEVEFE